MIDINTGFKIGAALAIDERFVFDTYADMEAYPETLIPDVYFSICKVDGNLYIYNVNNTHDPTTGKWRVVSGSGGSITQATSTALGGIKADDKLSTDTKYTMPVKIDPTTGILYSAYDPSLANTVYSYGLSSQVDPSSGDNYVFIDLNIGVAQISNYTKAINNIALMKPSFDDGTMIYIKNSETVTNPDGTTTDYLYGMYRYDLATDTWVHLDFLERDEFQNHCEDTDKHVSTADRYLWDNKADEKFEDTAIDPYTSVFVGRSKYIVDSAYLYDILVNCKNENDKLYADFNDFNDHKNDKTLVKHVTSAQIADFHAHSNKSVLDDISVDPTGVELWYKGSPIVTTSMSSHISDNDIHVTLVEKNDWNNHITNSAVHITSTERTSWTTHVGDSTIHITPADKTKWDGKADATAIPTLMSQLTDDIGLVYDASYVHTDNNFTGADKASIHTHANKTELDKISEDSTGRPLYDNVDYSDWNVLINKPTLNGIVIDSTKTLTDYGIQGLLPNEADVLLIGKDSSGNLTFDGKPVTASSIDWTNVTNKPFTSIDTTTLSVDSSGVLKVIGGGSSSGGGSGSGGGTSITVDSTLSTTSKNPVENQAITNELLTNYVTNTSLNTTLGNYVTNTAVTTRVTTEVTKQVPTEVAKQVPTEVTKQMATFITTNSLVNTTDLNNALLPYAKLTDLHSHANKTVLDDLSDSSGNLAYKGSELLMASSFVFETDDLDPDMLV